MINLRVVSSRTIIHDLFCVIGNNILRSHLSTNNVTINQNLLTTCNTIKPCIKSYINSTHLVKRHLNMELSTQKVAVCQMCSTDDKSENLRVGANLIEKAAHDGAIFVFLPECFDYIMSSSSLSISSAENVDGEIVNNYKKLALKNNVWLSLGGFHCNEVVRSDKIQNMHIIINNSGEIAKIYTKAHLFDVDIEGQVRLKESDYTVAGSEIVPPLSTPIGNIGMQICYDVRFPEMSLALRAHGADILLFPSAFTKKTGQAHWEVLMRSRAIENQCYVISAAQVGRHNEKRVTYGHAVIIDPWGTVVADCGEEVGVAYAEIDHHKLKQVRDNMPVMNHKRPDLYGSYDYNHIYVNDIDKRSSYTFGNFNITSTQVFYLTNLSYACVNIKPVVPGHILVIPLRCAERLTDLSPPEVTDMFMSVQKCSDMIQRVHDVSSVTVAIQDGPDSGQTVKHVHVHILPRKPNDVAFNDDIYNQLQKHDKNMDERQGLRSEADMMEEAMKLRTYFL